MSMSHKIIRAVLGLTLTATSVLAADKHDYIIVGLGTAGAVAARYLSDPDSCGKYETSVLVLEAGENYSQDPFLAEGLNQYIPRAGQLWFNPKYSFTTIAAEPTIPTPPAKMPFPDALAFLIFSHGRCWFGSSAHNGMTAIRGSSDFYDSIATGAGNPQWSYNNLLPYMKFLETYTGTSEQPDQRGVSGPLFMRQTNTPPIGNYPAIISSVSGAPILEDHNVSAANTVVATKLQAYTSQDGKTRVWAYNFLPTTILQPDGYAVGDRKLRVKSGAFVNKVIFEGTKAVGVEYISKSGKTKIEKAKKGVILCAGCPFSASILERSGVGDSAILSNPKVDVDVVVNNPLVGEGLKNHYGIMYAHTQSANPSNALAQSVRYFVDGSPFYAGAQVGVRKMQALLFPFLNLLPAGLRSSLGLPVYDNPLFPFIPGVQGWSWNLSPRSTGSSHIVSKSPFTVPEMMFQPYTDGDLTDPDSDLSVAVAMLKLVKQVADDAGGTMIYPEPATFTSDVELARAAQAMLTFSQYTWAVGHYAGTCNMGTGINNSVVSSHDLHVWGTERLYVADNSITEQPEDGNNAWTAYLFGLKMADILRGDVLTSP